VSSGSQEVGFEFKVCDAQLQPADAAATGQTPGARLRRLHVRARPAAGAGCTMGTPASGPRPPSRHARRPMCDDDDYHNRGGGGGGAATVVGDDGRQAFSRHADNALKTCTKQCKVGRSEDSSVRLFHHLGRGDQTRGSGKGSTSRSSGSRNLRTRVARGCRLDVLRGTAMISTWSSRSGDDMKRGAQQAIRAGAKQPGKDGAALHDGATRKTPSRR